MYIIVGLGNPGIKYMGTRHNIGFDFIDEYSRNHNIKVDREKFKGYYGMGTIFNEKVLLLKPITYMNLSGESIIMFKNFYNVDNDKIIIIFDDISLDVGRVRIRKKGSSGGHNGIKSIINTLSTEEFLRIKLGIGEPKHDLVDHVLSKFEKDERVNVDLSIEKSMKACDLIVSGQIERALNEYNIKN